MPRNSFAEKGTGSIEALLKSCSTLLYSGQKENPIDLVAITHAAEHSMERLLENAKVMEGKIGKKAEYSALIMGKYEQGIFILEEYFFPQNIEYVPSESLLERERFYNENPEYTCDVDCISSRGIVELTNAFQFKAIGYAKKKGMEVLGFDHTHPDHLIPSYADFAATKGITNTANASLFIVHKDDAPASIYQAYFMHNILMNALENRTEDLFPSERSAYVRRCIKPSNKVSSPERIRNIICNYFGGCE